MFTALRLSRGKAILDSDIAAVAMGYRQHLRKNLIHIMGDKLAVFKPVNM